MGGAQDGETCYSEKAFKRIKQHSKIINGAQQGEFLCAETEGFAPEGQSILDSALLVAFKVFSNSLQGNTVDRVALKPASKHAPGD